VYTLRVGFPGGTQAPHILIGPTGLEKLRQSTSGLGTTLSEMLSPIRCETTLGVCWELLGVHYATTDPSTCIPRASTSDGSSSTTTACDGPRWWCSAKEPWMPWPYGTPVCTPSPSMALVFHHIRSNSLTDWTLRTSSRRTTWTTPVGAHTSTPCAPSDTDASPGSGGPVAWARMWETWEKIV
jgi:hypothetical protein